MSYLNWIPFLFFLQILHTECASVKTLGDSVLLPTLAPNPELTRARNYADKLMVNLLTGYDKKKSSHKPLIIYTYMVIDHLREFNEVDMSMQLQAMFVLNWQDTRLRWEPKDYGNLTKITLSDYKMMRFWLPQIKVKAIMPTRKTIIQSTNTELLVTMNGGLFAAVRLATPITCDSQLEDYPFDTPNCSVYLVSRNDDDNSDVIFGNMHVFTTQNTFFNGKNVSKSKDMQVLNFTSTRYYVTTNGIKLQTNEAPSYIDPKIGRNDKKILTLGSFLHYQIFFRRNVITYSSEVLMPLLIGTVLMITAAASDNQRIALLLMVLTIYFEYMTMTRISFSLPPDYLKTPFSMRYATIIFLETLILFIYKLVFFYLLQTYNENEKVLQTLVAVNRYFKYFLAIQFVYCLFTLFVF